MNKKQNIYWICQICGWTFFAALNLFFFKLSYSTNLKDILNYLIWLPVGISITHFFRYLVQKFNILKFSIFSQIPIIVIAGFIEASMFFFLTVGIAQAFGIITYKINLVAAFSNVLSLTVIFIFWSLIYFGFHFFDNYKKTEIQNLKLEATTKEIELNKLKSQLNPHFMFNSMNSIRALVDEDPQKAKIAITQLSNILRNTLMMHKNKFISLEDELALVKDYLGLEHIRFEERLCYNLDIDPNTLNMSIPPMMIQTLVENGIKHGISKYPEGGEIKIKTQKTGDESIITIINTGQLFSSKNSESSGFGIENTTHRLEYLFGNKASFTLNNLDDKHVISEIIIKN